MTPPYFINPLIDALPSASPDERLKIVRHLAACIGDEPSLRAVLGLDPEEFARFYPDLFAPELSTEETIDSFLNRFAPEEAKTKKIQPDELVITPAADYTLQLESAPLLDEENIDDETSNMIDDFLQAVPPQKATNRRNIKEEKAPAAATEPAPHSDAGLSESLLKLMIKNKNYAKSIEIINELSLNNPKKSIYFAYQMRFLKKLIKNQESASK